MTTTGTQMTERPAEGATAAEGATKRSLPPASTRRGMLNPTQTPKGLKQVRDRIMDRGY